MKVDPEIMSGMPCFAGTRVPTCTLFDDLKGGDMLDGFLEDSAGARVEFTAKAPSFLNWVFTQDSPSWRTWRLGGSPFSRNPFASNHKPLSQLRGSASIVQKPVFGCYHFGIPRLLVVQQIAMRECGIRDAVIGTDRAMCFQHGDGVGFRPAGRQYLEIRIVVDADQTLWIAFEIGE